MFLNLNIFSVPVLHLTPSHNLTKLKEYNTVCYKQVNQYCHPSNLFIENVVFLKQILLGSENRTYGVNISPKNIILLYFFG